MSVPGRRLGPMIAASVLVAALFTGCGDSGKPSAEAPSPSPAVSVTASSTANACDAVKQIKQAVADLKKALTDKNLDAGKAAWTSLTDGVSQLAAAAEAGGGDAAQSLQNLLAPVTGNFAQLDTLAKLAAIVSALQLIGPTLDNAISDAQQQLSCPQ